MVYEDIYYNDWYLKPDSDHFIPEKHEHMEEFENILDDENKDEEASDEDWRPKFHSVDAPDFKAQYEASEIEDELHTADHLENQPGEPESLALAPKVPQ